MDKNIKKLIVVLVASIVCASLYFVLFSNKAMAPVEVVDNNPNSVSKEVCYLKITTGNGITDSQFISINYDMDSKVHGIMNWIPGEKDSLVGNYTGVVEDNNDVSYPKRLNVIYSGEGEGVISLQQEVLLLGTNDIVQMSGEKEDVNGVYKYKDINKLEKGYSIPMVDCATVAKNLKTDYLKD